MRLLLISNSTQYGSGYLDHCETQIRELLNKRQHVVFVPFALQDWQAYTDAARRRFRAIGCQLSGIHESGSNMADCLKKADAVYIGGGNTFRLLHVLYQEHLIQPLRDIVTKGVPYIGTSAGSNVACLSIKTTNDMPIVYPPSFDALQLVPFNINPHYIAPTPESTHMGETRDQRIHEFHEMNDSTVVGLMEGAMLNIDQNRVLLQGTTNARIFQKDQNPIDYQPGADLSFLMTKY